MSLESELAELRKKRKKEEEQNTYPGADLLYNKTDIAPGNLDTDIAPVANSKQDDERTWFQKGAFEDGYDFGDVSKSLAATSQDLRASVMGGLLDIGEGVVDAGASLVAGIGGLFSKDFKEDVEGFIKKDLYDGREVAKKIVRATSIPSLYTDPEIDNETFLGEKSQGVAASGGQLLGQMALMGVGVPWWVTSGVTSYGGEVENALNQDATLGEAALSGLISAGAEILTEQISGGIKFGGKALDDGLTAFLSTKIANKFVRNALKFGIDVAGEGIEEWLSEDISRFGQWLTYQDDKTLGEMLFSEEAMDAKIEAFIGGAALGGTGSGGRVVNSVVTGRDATSGLTANEEKVFNHVYEQNLADEAESKGRELTSKEKNKIYDETMEDLQKGRISTDTIESVLGGETYKTYKDTVDSENSLLEQKETMQAEFDTLQKMKQMDMTGEQMDRRDELRKSLMKLDTQIKQTERNSQRNALKNQLSKDVQGMLTQQVGKHTYTDDYLLESYAEKGRRSEKYTADVSKYKGKQAEVVQKAIDAGYLNNTRRTHEFVDLIAKIAADKDISFDFTTNEKLKESGFAVAGATVNGFVTKGGITLNMDSHKAWQSTVGHEITHVLEGTEFYGELQNAIKAYAETKGEYQSKYDAIKELYEGKDADIDAELTADLVGEYLFSDEAFVQHLSAKNRNVFQKIYDEIKYLLKVVTAGTKEARDLEKVKRAFDKAYKAETKTGEGTKLSISEDAKKADSNYLDAVNRGDNATAQRMVDEAADRAMPNSLLREGKAVSKGEEADGTLIKMFHGSGANGFYTFEPQDGALGKGVYLTSNWDEAVGYAIEKLGITETADGYEWNGEVYDGIGGIGEALETEGYVRGFYANVTDANDITTSSVYWEDVIALVRDTNQLKSADAITYDNNGKVIPISERFSENKNDVRYSLDKNRENSYNLYNSSVEYQREVTRRDKSTFARSLANNTSDMADGDYKLISIKCHDKIYYFGADGYMSGRIVHSKDVNGYKAKEKGIDEYSRAWINKDREIASLWAESVQGEQRGYEDDSDSIGRGRSNSFGTLSEDPYERYTSRYTERDRATFESKEEIDEIIRQLRELHGLDTEKVSETLAEDQTNEIAPIKASSEDGVFFDAKNRKYSLSDSDGKRLTKEQSEGVKYSLSQSGAYADTFYSQMAKVVDGVKQEKLGAASVVNMLRGKGVKAEEIKWSGIESFLEGKKSVTKQELQEFIAGSNLEITEQTLEGKDARWGEHKLEGGSNYREILFKDPKSYYTNSAMDAHWEDAGVIAHARVQDFDTANGKMLFVEEIQSDWHNAGQKHGYRKEGEQTDREIRKESDKAYEAFYETVEKMLQDKGYEAHPVMMANLFYGDEAAYKFISDPEMKLTTEELNYIKSEVAKETSRQKALPDAPSYATVPDAPFRDNYHEYVLKRLIREAAEKGYDSIGWTTAEMQNERWSEEYAEGYRIEYDQDIPKFLNKYGKKWGAQVGKTVLNQGLAKANEEYIASQEQYIADWQASLAEATTDSEKDFIRDQIKYHENEIANAQVDGETVWSIPITPAMKQSVLYEGQPKYSLSEYTAEEKKAHNDMVREHFGKTYKWAETGYLLLDGTRLDLSGKHDGAPGGYRTVDHRDITEALGYEYGGDDYSGSLIQFMSEGNIRIVPEISGINLSVKPNTAQEQALSDYISRNRGEVLLDIDDLNGNTVVSVEYPKGTYYKKVLDDIREWFDNGKKPVLSEFSSFRSLTKEGEMPRNRGYATPLSDLRLQEEIAPVADAPVDTATEGNVSEAEQVAPVETYAPQAEPTLYDLEREADAIRNRGAEAYAAKDTEAMNRIEQEMREVNAKIQQFKQDEAERTRSLDDADAPPEVDAPYFGENGQVTATDPFDNRDIKAVGNRKVKAYMYENPEVKPFFQAEANVLLGELQSTTKAESIYNGRMKYDMPYEVAQDIPTVYHVPRMTSDTIARLRDDFGMSYADIEKGLKAIIEDNGAENIAAAKKIEFAINENLLYGYNSYGTDIPPNQDYINLVKEKAITEYNEEAKAKLFENADAYAPADIAPMAETAEKPAETVKSVEGDIAPTPTVNKAKTEQKQTKTIASEEKIAEVLTEEEAGKRKKRGILSMFAHSVLDKGFVFENLSLKTGNRELQAKYNTMRYAEGMAQTLMQDGDAEAGVESLKNIKAEVEATGKVKEFGEYLYHLHNVDRMSLEGNVEARRKELDKKFAHLKPEQVKAIAAKQITEKTTEKTAETIKEAKEYLNILEVKNKPVFGDSVTADVSREVAAQLELGNPTFKGIAEKVYGYMNYLRASLVEGGVISQETADLWAKTYPHYVPIRRAGKDGAAINVPLDSGRTGINAPIKRATGGNSDILPFLDTMAMRTEQTFKAVTRNRFGVELKNTLGVETANEAMTIDEAIDSIDMQDGILQEGKDGANPTFTVFENGERVTFEITEEMYDALKPAKGLLAATIKPLNVASEVFRGLLTEYNLVFAATNAVKDVQDVLFNSQHATATYKAIPRAIKEIATKGKYYKEYLKNGGAQNTYFESDTKTFKEADKGIKKVIGLPLRAVSALNNTIERIPRMAEYIASREAGRSVDVSMLDAARVTTNFAAGGDVTKAFNRNGFTFLNASVQGAMQQVRNVREAKEAGFKGWAQLATKTMLAGLPALLLNGLVWDDDEDYEELSDYVKDNYYVVAKYGDGQFVRIPKGRMVAVVQDAFEQIGNAITGEDEVDLNNFLDLVKNNIAPNNPLDNNILAPIIQVANNKTWYGENLIPQRLQDLPAAEQYDESTDAISKWLAETAIGQKFEWSPYAINYLLNQYTGGIGDVVLPMLTPEAERGDDSMLGNLVAPWKDKFTTDSVMNNQNVSDFYELKDEFTAAANSVNATNEDTIRSKYFNQVSSQMSKLYQQKRQIQSSDLTDAEKYEQVRAVQERINSLAREALSRYGNVKRDDNYATVGDEHYYKNDNGNWTTITDEQYEKQEEVTSWLGIEPAEYWSNKSEYDFAYEHPGKYSVAKSIGGYEAYKKYSSELYDIKADKDEDGKSITGSRKEKVIDYVNNLNIDYGMRIIIFKSEYNADDTYNKDIVDYLNNRDDISGAEMKSILLELGFEVDDDGNIYW